MAKFPSAGRGMEWGEKEPVTPETLPVFVEKLKREDGMFVLATYTRMTWFDRKAWVAWEQAGKSMIKVAKDGRNFWTMEGRGGKYVFTQPTSVFWLPRQRAEESMGTMQEVFAASQDVLFEDEDVAVLDLIVEADDAWIAERFEAADADRLEFLADLLDAAAAGPLTEQQQLALEGLRSFIKKKLAPGTKMVFGKIVKVGKAVGGAAKAVGRAAVKTKREVQARTYRFTKAGKQARQAAKKVRDVKGRAAAQKSWAAAKETYGRAARAGETHKYASGQASKAQAGSEKRSTTAEYGSAPKKTKRKAPTRPQAPAKAAPKGKGAKGKGKAQAPSGKRRKRTESMDDVFQRLLDGAAE